jgi:hypothetical protein
MKTRSAMEKLCASERAKKKFESDEFGESFVKFQQARPKTSSFHAKKRQSASLEIDRFNISSIDHDFSPSAVDGSYE